MNKFEEMNYLVDKLQNKKQKKLKRITNEFNNEFTKVVKKDYDFDVPDNWCVVRKTYQGRDINIPFMKKYFEDVNEYKRKKDKYTLVINAEIIFKPRIPYSLFLNEYSKFKEVVVQVDIHEYNFQQKRYIVEREFEKYAPTNWFKPKNRKYKFKDIDLWWSRMKPPVKKPKIRFYYVTTEEIELLDQMKKDIMDKYDRLIENVKMEYIPNHLWEELIA
jgi:hypothetical protein